MEKKDDDTAKTAMNYLKSFSADEEEIITFRGKMGADDESIQMSLVSSIAGSTSTSLSRKRRSLSSKLSKARSKITSKGAMKLKQYMSPSSSYRKSILASDKSTKSSKSLVRHNDRVRSQVLITGSIIRELEQRDEEEETSSIAVLKTVASKNSRDHDDQGSISTIADDNSRKSTSSSVFHKMKTKRNGKFNMKKRSSNNSSHGDKINSTKEENRLVIKTLANEGTTKLDLYFIYVKFVNLFFYVMILYVAFIKKDSNTTCHRQDLITIDAQQQHQQPVSIFLEQDSITIYNEHNFITHVLNSTTLHVEEPWHGLTPTLDEEKAVDDSPVQIRESKVEETQGIQVSTAAVITSSFVPRRRDPHHLFLKHKSKRTVRERKPFRDDTIDDSKLLLKLKKERENSIRTKHQIMKKRAVKKHPKQDISAERLFHFIVHVL